MRFCHRPSPAPPALQLLPLYLKTPEQTAYFKLQTESEDNQEDMDEVDDPSSFTLKCSKPSFLCMSLVVSLCRGQQGIADSEALSASEREQLALQSRGSTAESVLNQVVKLLGSESFENIPYLSTVVLPGGDSVSHTMDSVSDMFHYDALGKSCFSLSEAELTSKYLADSDFVNALQARVRDTSFHFSQLKHQDCSTYCCNETFYSNFKFLEMTGLVKLSKP